MASFDEAIRLMLSPSGLSIIRSLLAIAVLSFVLWLTLTNKHEGQKPGFYKMYYQNYFLPCIVPFGLAWIWQSSVSRTVPEPYLDEFFHIPQAQVYCEGKYLQWDDKITTPPGLYVFSIIWAKLAGFTDCSADTLRLLNVFTIAFTAVIAGACRTAIEKFGPAGHRGSIYSIHTAVNIGLFPTMFFFSGLYYTDVLSTGAVLLAYRCHLKRVNRSKNTISLTDDFFTIFLGILSLCMRQTNVFWVVVYMGGLEAVQAVKSIKPTRVETPDFRTLEEQFKFYAQRYASGEIHDPSLNVAFPADIALCAISIAIASICNIGTVLRRVYPHIVVMALFVGFVVWNGGVVLGDKSNHVATLHLAQMLYIWPLFAFFSAPLFISQVVRFLHPVLASVTRKSSNATTTQRTKQPRTKASSSRPSGTASISGSRQTSISSSPPKRLPALKVFNSILSNGPLLSLAMVFISLLGALVIIQFNTIVHPFTLADNRHYMFYVFRYTILRGTLVRLALAPVYVFCAFLSWSTLSGCVYPWFAPLSSTCPAACQEERFISSPWISPQVDTLLGQAFLRAGQPEGATVQPQEDGELYVEYAGSTAPPSTSTVLVLLLATTLSLVTAPLVEPRYFILPWVFWRLLVPAWPAHVCTYSYPPVELSSIQWLAALVRLGRDLDLRLVLESAWFLVVNGATMYIFLTRPFYWKAEDGTLLDGGSVQRFMW